MARTVISVEHLTKSYDLGVIGTGTISRDLNRWWARIRKQPDPYTRIGNKDAFSRIGESILALDDVSFTVQQGEALGIIGRNGAGKSTLLKILSRVTAPTSGMVKVKGRIGSLLEVGTGFHPELTGRENVYLNGAILGMKKSEVTRKFDEIVEFSGVEKFIDTPVKRYSSGMYVRLAFAVAAHLDPEILIVDEVLAVGDAEFQKKCLGKMGAVAGEGRTVLFVSHNLASIESLCTKAVLFDLGQIASTGFATDVISFYLNQFQKNSNTLGFDYQSSTAPLRFEDFKILLGGNIPSEIVNVGDRIDLKIKINVNEPCSNIFFGVTLFDEWNNTVFAFHAKETGILVDKIVDEWLILKIEIPHFLVMPGIYHFRLLAVNDSGTTLQEINPAALVTVYPRDLSRSGHLFSRAHGSSIIPFRMQVISQRGNRWVKSVLLDGWDTLSKL